jgi:hypothetical protein
MSGLRRFWFEFDVPEAKWPAGSGVTLDFPPGSTLAQMYLKRGCGVTGYDQADCEQLIRADLLKGENLPPITRVIENVDVQTLDRGHVIPNMGVVVWRGVWWPGLNRSGPSET